MAQSKRASMREGPLAALFSKTEEEQAKEPEPPAAEEAEQPAGKPGAAPRSPAAFGERVRGAPAKTWAAHRAAPDTRQRSRRRRAIVGVGGGGRGARGIRGLRPQPKGASAQCVLLGDPRKLMRPRPAEKPAEQPAKSRAREEEDVYARGEARSLARAGEAAGAVIQPVIRVVGVGGAGVNAVNRMVEAEVAGVEFLAINTDLQSLQQSTADITLHIGAELTRGLGSGSDTNLGRRGGDGGLRPREGPAEGLGHDLHHRGRRRWHGHGRGADRRADRARSGRADGGDRDQAVRLRGLPPREQAEQGVRRWPKRWTR